MLQRGVPATGNLMNRRAPCGDRRTIQPLPNPLAYSNMPSIATPHVAICGEVPEPLEAFAVDRYDKKPAASSLRSRPREHDRPSGRRPPRPPIADVARRHEAERVTRKARPLPGHARDDPDTATVRLADIEVLWADRRRQTTAVRATTPRPGPGRGIAFSPSPPRRFGSRCARMRSGDCPETSSTLRSQSCIAGCRSRAVRHPRRADGVLIRPVEPARAQRSYGHAFRCRCSSTSEPGRRSNGRPETSVGVRRTGGPGRADGCPYRRRWRARSRFYRDLRCARTRFGGRQVPTGGRSRPHRS